MTYRTLFSLRRVAVVVGALAAVALLVPVGARAAGTFMTIVGSDDEPADVVNGHLHVSNSDKMPLTVRASRAVPVSGDVGSHPDTASMHLQGRRQLGRNDKVGAFGPNRHFSYADKVAITSITVSAYRQFEHVAFYALAGSNCDNLDFHGPRRTVYLLSRVKEGTLHLAFPEPLMVSTPDPGSQRPWCLIINPTFGDGPISLDVLTIGHVVPQN